MAATPAPATSLNNNNNSNMNNNNNNNMMPLSEENLHGSNPSTCNLPLLSSFFGRFSEREPSFVKTCR